MPIFNQGKRPRQALVAHPNNHGGVSREVAATQHYKTTYARLSWGGKVYSLHATVVYSIWFCSTNINKENRDPCFFSKQPQEDAYPQRKGKFTPYQYQQGLGRKSQLISHNSAENWNHEAVAQDHRQLHTTAPSARQYKGFTAHDQSPMVPAVGNAIIKAREPSEVSLHSKAAMG